MAEVQEMSEYHLNDRVCSVFWNIRYRYASFHGCVRVDDIVACCEDSDVLQVRQLAYYFSGEHRFVREQNIGTR